MLLLLLDILRVVLGIAVAAFVPGYLILSFYMKEVDGVEKVLLSIAISIVIATGIGLVLGLLGILIFTTVVLSYGVVFLVIIIPYLSMNQYMRTKHHDK